MQWFKHQSNMSFDVKVKRVIRKYGVEGYGLYNYILESIARNLSESSPYPDLEDVSEDIASDLKMDSRRVEEIMGYMIQQRLFDYHEASNRIICMKMIDYLDEYHRKKGKASPIRKALQDIEVRHCQDTALITSGDVAQEEEKEEEKNREEKRPASAGYTQDFLTFWQAYPSSEGKRPAFKAWEKMWAYRPPLDEIVRKVEQWKTTEKWKAGYVRNAATWINQAGWEDELPKNATPSSSTKQTEIRICEKHMVTLDNNGVCYMCEEEKE